jgi:RHS repeat-associated protein
VEKQSLRSAETVKYEWDHRNRLVKVITPKETVEYVYDYRNRLVRRNEEFFVHDEWQIVLTLDSKGKVKNRNLWGANQDELLTTNDQLTLCDHLGSVRDIIDVKGKVTGHREYNAFGKVTRTTGKADCMFGYTGKMFDNQTQLQWNINRWYDANLGRWISEDPIGFKGKDWNLTRYVKNYIIIAFDPLGNFIWHCFDCTDGGADTATYGQPFKVTSYTTTFTTTGKYNCQAIEQVILDSFTGILSFYLFKKAVLAGVAAAITSNCQCKIQMRYKTYQGHDWYGEYCVGWALIGGYAYNYKYEKSGPLETDIYSLEVKYFLGIGDSGPCVQISDWQQIPLTRTKEEVEFSAQWHQWATYAPGEWTGYIYP